MPKLAQTRTNNAVNLKPRRLLELKIRQENNKKRKKIEKDKEEQKGWNARRKEEGMPTFERAAF